jgi:nucleotide-binding universal stress UspA family protein
VRAVTRLVRARRAGPAIVEEASRRNAELIVVGSPKARRREGGKAIFGRTVDYVLKTSPSRVLVVAGKRAA